MSLPQGCDLKLDKNDPCRCSTSPYELGHIPEPMYDEAAVAVSRNLLNPRSSKQGHLLREVVRG